MTPGNNSMFPALSIPRFRTSALGQKRKFSPRAHVVRFTLESRHSSERIARPLSAISAREPSPPTTNRGLDGRSPPPTPRHCRACREARRRWQQMSRQVPFDSLFRHPSRHRTLNSTHISIALTCPGEGAVHSIRNRLRTCQKVGLRKCQCTIGVSIECE
jgi:hypothetical protein